MTDKELVKHCMCGCMYLKAECPNCNKVSDADRIEQLVAINEALTAKVKLMDDLDVINVEKIEALTAKNEMLGREVNIARYGQPDFAWSVHVQVMDDLNAKLAKAVEALREIAGECGCSTARAIIAEIEGEKG